MSLHIGAAPGDIARTVLIAGDPLRAKYVADTMLTDVMCYNEIRGMLGFTGFYKGKRVSVQGTGIGIPSTAIYIHEFIHSYDVEKIIRIGTCGGIQPALQLDQLILATGAYTDSGTHMLYYSDFSHPVDGSAAMVQQARTAADRLGISATQGLVFSTDMFYRDDDAFRWDKWIEKGVIAVEMETSILYALAEKYSVEALSILSVSDNIITSTKLTPIEREEASREQMVLALEVA
jgi:purine-nucleoside phosphorylase